MESVFSSLILTWEWGGCNRYPFLFFSFILMPLKKKWHIEFHSHWIYCFCYQVFHTYNNGLKNQHKNLWRILRSVRTFLYLIPLTKGLRCLFLSKFLSSLVKVQPGIGDFVSENYFWLKFNTFHDLTSNFLTFPTVNSPFSHTEILYLSQCQFFFLLTQIVILVKILSYYSFCMQCVLWTVLVPLMCTFNLALNHYSLKSLFSKTLKYYLSFHLFILPIFIFPCLFPLFSFCVFSN